MNMKRPEATQPINMVYEYSATVNQQKQVSGSVHISASAEDPPDLLLSVPFYVCEEFAWINATYMGRPISDVARNMKHGDDYWFLEASLKHPMRTHNMSEAKLFFVPFLLNHLDKMMYYKGPLCSNGKCDFELLLDTQQRLRESKAFQLYPDRHLIVRSCYNSAGDPWNQKLQKYEGYNRFMELYFEATGIRRSCAVRLHMLLHIRFIRCFGGGEVIKMKVHAGGCGA
jgi:hypothetical protein